MSEGEIVQRETVRFPVIALKDKDQKPISSYKMPKTETYVRAGRTRVGLGLMILSTVSRGVRLAVRTSSTTAARPAAHTTTVTARIHRVWFGVLLHAHTHTHKLTCTAS